MKRKNQLSYRRRRKIGNKRKGRRIRKKKSRLRRQTNRKSARRGRKLGSKVSLRGCFVTDSNNKISKNKFFKLLPKTVIRKTFTKATK